MLTEERISEYVLRSFVEETNGASAAPRVTYRISQGRYLTAISSAFSECRLCRIISGNITKHYESG